MCDIRSRSQHEYQQLDNRWKCLQKPVYSSTEKGNSQSRSPVKLITIFLIYLIPRATLNTPKRHFLYFCSSQGRHLTNTQTHTRKTRWNKYLEPHIRQDYGEEYLPRKVSLIKRPVLSVISELITNERMDQGHATGTKYLSIVTGVS